MNAYHRRKPGNHLLALLVLALGTFIPAEAQTIQLPLTWKLTTGDNLEWAAPEFNDSLWKTTNVGTSWSVQGQDTVYAWYRTRIFISSDKKKAIDKGNGVTLRLGKIDDVDQTFFNGKKIGETGSFPPLYETQWNVNRTYFIPPEEIRYDTDNVIAVRVFSHIGGVGMYEGPFTYTPTGWHDFVVIDQTVSPLAGHSFSSTVTFTNKGTQPCSGTVEYFVKSSSDSILHTEVAEIHIQPGPGKQNVWSFAPYDPDKEAFVTVGYQFTESESNSSVRDEQFYLAKRQIEISVGDVPKPVVQDRIPVVFAAIPFGDQQLKGYLKKRLMQNLEERLLKVDEKGMMEGYLKRPGNQPWIGEHVGKYLEAASNVWNNTHDARLKRQMDRMMFTLINTQLRDGYLGTYDPWNHWTSWDVWSHKYNLYGLLGYYRVTGYQPALETCKRIGDLLCETFGNSPGQRDIVLAGEHVGMAATSVLDPMVELYRYTGDTKYLDFCFYIVHSYGQTHGPNIIRTLLETGQVNRVANGKAYEMLSNIVGLVNLYRLTGEETYLAPALRAWQDVVSNRLYITGTTSSHEIFQDDDVLPATDNDNVGEGCVTVTWIQLNRILLEVTGELRFAEQIEKTVYNHLLGSENPQNGCVSYYTPLMDSKPFAREISCCVSSVPRGIAMIPHFTFGNVKGIPTLVLYEPASYEETITSSGNESVRLSIQVSGSFPERGELTIEVHASRAATFPIALRVPAWCSSFTARVGGNVFKGTQGEYLTITRAWRSHNSISVSLDMPVQTLAGGKSYPDHIAFQRGPQVLAIDKSLNAQLLNDTTALRRSVDISEFKNKPRVLPKKWIGRQSYSVSLTGRERGSIRRELILVPFADAGQTGAAIQVWMPLRLVNN